MNFYILNFISFFNFQTVGVMGMYLSHHSSYEMTTSCLKVAIRQKLGSTVFT